LQWITLLSNPFCKLKLGRTECQDVIGSISTAVMIQQQPFIVSTCYNGGQIKQNDRHPDHVWSAVA